MRPRIFGQDADILASCAGTTAGTVGERRRHISWAAWVQTSLNPHQNDQGRKGPCYFRRLIALILPNFLLIK